jgi:hypothetical protein
VPKIRLSEAEMTTRAVFTFYLFIMSIIAVPGFGQQVPGTQPGIQTQPEQMPLQYSFRPNLSNPEYGECLGLEKRWKELHTQYATEYERARYVRPGSTNFNNYMIYIQNLRYEAEKAWMNFSSRCVYFPRNE